jgi:thiol-disulfide isomerase/thioredoxin
LKQNTLVLGVVVIAVSAMIYFGAYKSRRVSASIGDGPRIAGNVKGQAAPDWELKTLDGRTVRLSDLKGKAVLLNFWATWCGPCKVEMPWFVDFQKQYGPQGLEIVGIAMDDSDDATISDFTREMHVNYTILRGKESVGEAYGGVMGLPTTFFIGRDGKILDQTAGLVSRSEIEQNIKLALAQKASAQAGGK